MSFSDRVQCQMCKRAEVRINTLILETPRGRFRLCRNCYAEYSSAKLNDEYQEAKRDIRLYNIKDLDAYSVTKTKEDFIRKIKGGWNGRT